MAKEPKLEQGSLPWFEMVGGLMCDAAAHAGLPSDLTLSLVERYVDGAPLAGGLIQGLRFEISEGVPSFRLGAWPDEQGDITIEITAAAALELNRLYSADPVYGVALERLTSTGGMQVRGDLSRLGDWMKAVHDPIVARTAPPGTADR